MEMSKTRITWIDITKGIAIILMILGHIPNLPECIRVFIFSFHMPLFMIVNGYLIRNYDVGRSVRKSAESLLKPYFFVAVAEAVLAMLMAPDIETAGENLFSGLNDAVAGMSYASTKFTRFGSVWLIWFLTALFLARNIYIALCAVSGKKVWKLLTGIGCVFFAGYCTGKYIAFLPWSLDVAMVSVVFIAAGDFIRLHIDRIRKYQLPLGVICGLVWGALLYKGIYIELSVRRYPYILAGVIGAVAGSVLIMGISTLMGRERHISSVLSWYGRNSLLLLAVYCIEMRFFNWNEWIYKPLNWTPEWYMEFILRFICISFVTYTGLYVFEKIRRYEDTLRDQSQNRGRLDWPDVAKGICIISVIIGHLGVNFINRIVFIYHLPVFFILAGYFLKKKEEKTFIASKARRLLVPYTVTCCAICAIAAVRAVRSGGSVKGALGYWIRAALYGAGDNWTKPYVINAIGAIWFLWAMFWALIIVNHFIGIGYFRPAVFGIAFMGWASFDRTQVWLPLSIQAGMLAALYLLTGYEFRQSDLLDKVNNYVLFALFLIFAWSIWHFKGFWLVHDYMGNGWLDFLTSICASIVIISLSKYICDKYELIKRIFAWLGRNSLIILCFHIIELNVLLLTERTQRIATGLMHMNPNQFLNTLILVKIIYVVLATIVFNKCMELVKDLRASAS